VLNAGPAAVLIVHAEAPRRARRPSCRLARRSTERSAPRNAIAMGGDGRAARVGCIRFAGSQGGSQPQSGGIPRSPSAGSPEYPTIPGEALPRAGPRTRRGRVQWTSVSAGALAARSPNDAQGSPRTAGGRAMVTATSWTSSSRERGSRDSIAGEARHDYRFDPKSRIIFFSRLRASASTWSFHRSVAHSGRLVPTPEMDRARLPALAGGFGNAWPTLGFAASLCIVLRLDAGIAHLLAVLG
jgi:hypothetical protein